MCNLLTGQLILLLSQTSPRRSPCHPRGSGSNWGSRRSSWNSLGRAPSLKRKDTSGERESLLSGDGRGSFEDEDLEGEKLANISGGSLQHPSSLDIPELPQTPSFSSLGEYHDCNGRSLHIPTDLSTTLSKEDSIAEEDMDDVSRGLTLENHTCAVLFITVKQCFVFQRCLPRGLSCEETNCHAVIDSAW